MVPTRTFHRPFLLPHFSSSPTSRQLSSRSSLSSSSSARPGARPLNLLSKYSSSHPRPSSSSFSHPGLDIPTPPLPHLPKDALSEPEKKRMAIPVEPVVTSFSRSGDREEKRGGGVDDAFVVEGVKVPERPLKPGEEDCCMSGCVHCIYDIYASSLVAYQDALSVAHSALLASSRPRSEWPKVILEREERGVGGGVKEAVPEEMMDPAMKAFMEMEARLKEKQNKKKKEAEGG